MTSTRSQNNEPSSRKIVGSFDSWRAVLSDKLFLHSSAARTRVLKGYYGGLKRVAKREGMKKRGEDNRPSSAYLDLPCAVRI